MSIPRSCAEGVQCSLVCRTCQQLATALADASSEEGSRRRLLGDARTWGSEHGAGSSTEHQGKLLAGNANPSSTASTEATIYAADELPGSPVPTAILGDANGARGGLVLVLRPLEPRPTCGCCHLFHSPAEVLLGAAADYSVAGDYYYIGQPDCESPTGFALE